MRCYICDSYIDEPRIDRKTGKVAHCSDCQEVIDDTVGGFDDDENDEFELEQDYE